MTSKCRAVANYIIDEINKFNIGKQLTERVWLSTKRLQKLLYFCDIEYIINCKINDGQPMFEDDFYAWPNGPVIPSVYAEFAQFQNGEMRSNYNGDIISLTKETKTMIDLVLESTKNLDTIDLVNISNVVGGPWYKVFEPDDPEHKQIISKEDIYNYYLNNNVFQQVKEGEINMKKTSAIEEVVDSATNVPYIDDDGNIAYLEGSNKVHIAVEQTNEYGSKLKQVSNDYYYIERIFEDHYIVCDVNSSQFLEYEEYFDDSKLSFKYGVIALQRNENGEIIPMGEKVVVPILYDKISENNLKTVTAYANNHLTYIDVNPNSENYGKQLVPAVLEHAVPFSVEYEGFAECSVNGVVGYLPRNCQPRTSLSPLNLLTKKQVKYLLSYLEFKNDSLHKSSIDKYTELTGNTKVLKLTKK